VRLKLLLPGFLLAPVAGLPGGVKPPEELATRNDDIVVLPPPDAPAAAATADAAGSADAPAAHAIDLAGHLQLPLELPERTRGIGRVKEHAYAILHRTQSSDAAAGAYIATSTGGGRITTIATIIGFCVSGAGAGALCVATGVVQAPGWILDGSDRAPAPRPAAKSKPRESKPRRPAELTASSRTTEVIATPTPAPTPHPPKRRPRTSTRTATQDPSQGTTPTSHENAPISQAPQGSTAEFGPESAGTASTASAPPAPPPATGGDEFLP